MTAFDEMADFPSRNYPSSPLPLSDGKLDGLFQRRNLVCMKLFSEGIIRLRNMLTMKRLSIQAETGKKTSSG